MRTIDNLLVRKIRLHFRVLQRLIHLFGKHFSLFDVFELMGQFSDPVSSFSGNRSICASVSGWDKRIKQLFCYAVTVENHEKSLDCLES